MPIGITRNLVSWQYQDHHVERVMDNAAYTSAHPDDTLALAGPARVSQVSTAASIDGSEVQSLLAIGMVQNLQISQVKSTTPVMAIGSGRSFFISGKAQGNGSIARLFVNGRNLLRALYHNARAGGLDVTKLDDKPAEDISSQYYINLDSELYLVPFGLGVVFRTKSHQAIGAFYAELTMIQSYNISIQAGANMIAEQVSFMFDRLAPFTLDVGASENMPAATMNTILGFMDTATADAGEVDDLASAVTIA
jgi:hypothetical protein